MTRARAANTSGAYWRRAFYKLFCSMCLCPIYPKAWVLLLQVGQTGVGVERMVGVCRACGEKRADAPPVPIP